MILNMVRWERQQRNSILETIEIYETNHRWCVSNGAQHAFLPHTFASWYKEPFWDFQ